MPGRIQILTLCLLLWGTISTAPCTVVESPEPFLSTTIILVPFSNPSPELIPCRHETSTRKSSQLIIPYDLSAPPPAPPPEISPATPKRRKPRMIMRGKNPLWLLLHRKHKNLFIISNQNQSTNPQKALIFNADFKVKVEGVKRVWKKGVFFSFKKFNFGS